eukprot:XP_011667204.1 PREDICTED: exportin-2-like [Strongylocentrotus purpuratus]
MSPSMPKKYDEEFQEYLPNFVMAVWNLLVSTGAQVKYDLLISNAIQFLASVADRDHYKHLFESPDTLKGICEKVIVPNMEFRGADEELFELNPEEYIRRDIEGSEHLQPHVEALLTNLFNALTMQGSEENEYIMKGEKRRPGRTKKAFVLVIAMCPHSDLMVGIIPRE